MANMAKYYEVFGRIDSDDKLTHLGSVEAPNSDLAVTRAWYIYDQLPWIEMCLVPTLSIIPISPRSDAHSPIRAV